MTAGSKTDTQGHLRWHQKAKLKAKLNPFENVSCSLGTTVCLFFAGYIGKQDKLAPSLM